MDASKEATQFVQNLADKFLRRGNVISFDKTMLRQHFKVEVQKLKDDDSSLAEFLDDNQRMYSKSFIKLVKYQLKTSSNLNNKKNDSDNLPYNLFSSSKLTKKNIEKQSVNEHRGIYSAYLYERLNHIQNCDDVVELLHSCRSCEKASWVEDVQKMCTFLNFQMEPKILQRSMEIFSGKVSEELQRSGQREESLTKMKSVIEDFITFCTRKRQEIKDFPTKPKYNDLLAAIVSVYVDVILLIFHNRDESEKRKEGRRLCGWVCLVFCNDLDFILDVLVQVSMCKSSDGPIILPLCNKALAKPSGEYDAVFYTKYIVAVAQYTKRFPGLMSDIFLESQNVPAPGAYLEWLRGKDASIADLLVADNKTKKTRITKYLLRSTDEDLPSKLLDLLVDSDGRSQVTECLLEGVPGVAESDNVHELNGQVEEFEVAFCIDREPDMDFELTNAETSQNSSFYQQIEEPSAVAEMETDAQRNEFGNDPAEEIMELEKFQAENDGADGEKKEEEIEEERDKNVEDEKDFEMEDENGEEDGNIRMKEEIIVEYISSCDDSKEEWKTDPLKMRTSPQKRTVSPQKLTVSPLKMIPEMKTKANVSPNVSPRKISSSSEKINGSSQKVSPFYSQDVVARSQKMPERLALSPSSSLSVEDSDEEEFEGKTMTPQKRTTGSQKSATSPQKITLSPSSSLSSMGSLEEEFEGKELEADREKLTAGVEFVENAAKELPEDVNKDPGTTKSKSLEKLTLIEIASDGSTSPLVLEDSSDEEQSEKLVNRVLDFIDHSNASEKDLFEEFKGGSNQPKRLAESEANNDTAVLKRLSQPKVDPDVLKSTKHTNRDPTSGRYAKYSPSSLMSGIYLPELETSKQRKRSSSEKSVTPLRQDGFGTPQKLSKNLDETTIPDSSELSTPEHNMKSENVPDLSKFLKSPRHSRNVYNFASDSSPPPLFTSILMRHKRSEIEKQESSSNMSESVNLKSARFSFSKTYSHDRTNLDKKHLTTVDDAKKTGECSGIDRKLDRSPRKVIASPASNSAENVAAKKSKLEGEETAQIRRSARIIQQQMKLTPTKEKTEASSSGSSSRKRQASYSEKLQKTRH